MHVWGELNVKLGMLGLFPSMFKHSPLLNAHLKYYHTWKRCTSGPTFFKRMNEEQHCHKHPRWLCWLWLCSGCWPMRMNNPLCFHCSVFQVPSFELGLEHISNSTWWPHWNQWVAGGCGWEQNVVRGPGYPTSSTGTRKLRSRSFSVQHANNGSTTCSPTWTLGCLCPGLHASGVASRFWAAQGWAEHTSSAVPSPRAGSRRWSTTGSLSRPTRDRITTFINASTKNTQLGIKH